jgi:hypothetical protein
VEYGIVLVPSTSHAIKGEKLLLQSGLTVKLIPTPRQLSSDCGMSLRFAWAERERVEELLREKGILIDRVIKL